MAMEKMAYDHYSAPRTSIAQLYRDNPEIAEICSAFSRSNATCCYPKRTPMPWRDKNIHKLIMKYQDCLIIVPSKISFKVELSFSNVTGESYYETNIYHEHDPRVDDVKKFARPLSWYKDKYYKSVKYKYGTSSMIKHYGTFQANDLFGDDAHKSIYNARLFDISSDFSIEDFPELRIVDPNLVLINELSKKLLD